MRKSLRTLIAAAALAASAALAPVLYAHDTASPGEHDGSMTGSGMMGMNMMGQMGDMMDGCNRMMQGTTDGGAGKPNEQWRRDTPAAPDTNS